MVSLQTKSQSFENVVQLFRIDSRSHPIALSPFWEEVFKARANLLTKGDEHIVCRQFIERFLGEVCTIKDIYFHELNLNALALRVWQHSIRLKVVQVLSDTLSVKSPFRFLKRVL